LSAVVSAIYTTFSTSIFATQLPTKQTAFEAALDKAHIAAL
jgi:hypothetical protein